MGRRAGGTHDPPTPLREQVGHAAAKRHLRANDGQVDTLGGGQRQDGTRVGHVDGPDLSRLRNAGIAGRDENGVHVGFARESRCERVLARAGSDDQYFHCKDLQIKELQGHARLALVVIA